MRSGRSSWSHVSLVLSFEEARRTNTLIGIDHPNVTAVVFAGLPGQEAGNSLVDILYGDVNPSGKLPFTVARNASDYPAVVIRGGNFGQDVLDVQYYEGLEIDYRWFDAVSLISLKKMREMLTEWIEKHHSALRVRFWALIYELHLLGPGRVQARPRFRLGVR
jgi:hypothetical protein